MEFVDNLSQQILELREILDNVQSALPTSIAHNIQGAAANISAYRIREIAREMEIEGNKNNRNKFKYLTRELEVEYQELKQLIQNLSPVL